MTRKRQSGVLAIVVAGLLTLIGVALAAKLSGVPKLLELYEFIRDTSLLLVTVIAAYLAHIYQRRNTFLDNLRGQWREIVQAKAALIYYCHLPLPKLEDYLAAARQISETIDNMRIVYSNVGETDDLIGFYPYAPLQHMSRVLEALDPRKTQPTPAQLEAARSEIWEAFNVIREHFLDEFDIDSPSWPVLADRMRRKKQPGASAHGQTMMARQIEEMKARDPQR
ncbi:MAG: hypothetical protein NW215_10335 [Hyphomicrobiales bacterium]|nr:hypothetical protein [Hyphomicrobiales bacterium]